ncbi:metalloproteinase inhibitor 3-like [Hydractinia symbiolongicarpus]|uniref:metalloproteinase inhibitor 3-like n=1 Tax=Hydractinia symbiolongicarpus TaxID=13093 RepID=UPI002550E51B|nr:metalloproteinase inhibitor 3-like [Hydractinia symbiolongicarpus]
MGFVNYTFTVFLSLLSFSRLAIIVESCVCMPAHPQNAFCNSDFVIKVTITSKHQYSLVENYQQYVDMGLPPLQIAFYNITVMKIFKGQSNIQHLLREEALPKLLCTQHQTMEQIPAVYC